MVTSIRLLCSVWMLYTPVFSTLFYVAYLLCGLTDMVDGTIARKTKSDTRFGAYLDSVADIVFVTVSFIKIWPAIHIPNWLYGWILMIVIIRIANIGLGLIYQKRLVFAHTVMNKLTGFLLFLLPLTLSVIELRYSSMIVCIIATFSAVQEGYHIWTERIL